ncbi:MAG: TonB-dependent receptor [Bryobacteraceae bacterium]
MLLLAVACNGQVSTGSLGGEVRDPSGALIDGVRITVSNLATQFERTVTTSSLGVFRAADLAPGIYRVSAEKAGFQTAVAASVAIDLNQHARLDFGLLVGSGSESVTVDSAVTPVQADEASIGYQLPAPAIRGLPLAKRNVLAFVTLGPAAIPRQLGGFGHDIVNDVQASRGAVAINPPVNGARSTANVFLLDGIYNTDRTVFVIASSPLIESIQDVRVLSSTAAAEFPQNGGGVIDIATRAGSKAFHGSAFEFFQNEKPDARGFFEESILPKSIYRQNEYGASLGGRLPVSSTYFFGSFEGARNRDARSRFHILPDASMRAGDLRASQPLFDPLSSTPGGGRLPFAQNRIPGNRIDPIATRFFDLYEPLPNRARDDRGNYLDSTPNQNDADHGSVRVDHQFRNRSQLFGRYTINDERNRVAGSFPQRPTLERLRAQQVAIGYTIGGASWMNAPWLNDVRVGFTRLRTFSFPESAFQTDVIRDLGIISAQDDPLFFGLPAFNITNSETVQDDTTRPQTQRNNTWYFSDGFSQTRGRHTWKAGLQAIVFQLNYLQSQNPRGQYIYNGFYSQDPLKPGVTGDPFADFLLGFPQITRRTVGSPLAYLRQHDIAGYLQDDWRVSSRLTVNLGLRYEYISPYSEKRNNLINLDYSTLPKAPRLVSVDTPTAPDRNNFAPRVGLAYRLPKVGRETVFRAGYGVFFNTEIAIEAYDLIRNGLRNEINQTNSLKPVLTTRDGFPTTAALGLPSYYGLDTNARTPYIQQWTASVQRDFGYGLLGEIAYAGTKGTKLGRFRRFNTPQQVETGANLDPRPGDLQSLRTFPELGPIFQRQHISNSSYNSLQLKVEKRYRSQLGLLASYVWSKSIDDADSILPGQYDSFGAQDERNLRLERGLSFFDVKRRFSAGFVYDLPSVHVFRALLGGWRLSGILTFQDGTPLNPVYFGADFANSGTPNRPNIVAGQKVALPEDQRSIYRYFNTDAFSTPAPYTFGNAGRDTIPGPGNAVIDASLQKRFRLTEAMGLDFRAEAFNLANHPNLGIPGPYPDFGPFFGRIFVTGPPRRLQFGLRLDF